MAKKQENVPTERTPSEVTTVHGQSNSASDVDRIRQIIFGAQMEEYETRFAALEKRLHEAVDVLRTEMSRGLADLQQEVAGKNSEVNGRLAETEKTLRDDLGDLASRQAAEAKELVERISRLQAAVEEDIEAVVKRFEEASAALRGDMLERNSDLLKTLETRVRELRAVKADRATLAALLTNLAGNLTADPGSVEGK